MNRRFVVSVILLFVLMIAACAQQEPVAQEESTPAQEESTPAEEAAVATESPIETPRAMVSMLPTVTPFPPPENLGDLVPAPGQAVVYGRILSTQTSMPVANTPVRLAEIYYADETKDPATGAWALNNASSPFAYTDENGLFVFENVPAHDYVVFVGDMEGQYTVAAKEDGFPQAFTFESDTVTDLGEISVDYTP